MPPRCPNCKGKMDNKPPHYVCTECGLVIKRYEFDKVKREYFPSKKTDEEDTFSEDKKKKKEYLDWFLSSNKDEYEE